MKLVYLKLLSYTASMYGCSTRSNMKVIPSDNIVKLWDISNFNKQELNQHCHQVIIICGLKIGLYGLLEHNGLENFNYVVGAHRSYHLVTSTTWFNTGNQTFNTWKFSVNKSYKTNPDKVHQNRPVLNPEDQNDPRVIIYYRKTTILHPYRFMTAEATFPLVWSPQQRHLPQ